jgi:ATP-binding cassette subfamily F protein 3
VISRARGLRIGYFAQEQVDALRPEDSAFMHMQRLAPQERDQTLRNWLAQFAFQGEDATRPVGPMSGGERARLALAMLVWGRPHVLILDEPTNHLDAPTRDALADALAEFDGALLLVSHDRYILRHTVDELLRISDQHMSPFDGDLEDYAKWLLKSPTAADGAPTPQPSSPPPQRREERRAAAAHRARQAAQRKPLIQALNQVEARIKDLETRMAGIDAELAQPETYTLGVHTTDLVRQRTALHDEHSALEERWLALSADLDTLDEAALCENITPASKAPKLD